MLQVSVRACVSERVSKRVGVGFMGWEGFLGASEADVPLIPKSICVKKHRKETGGEKTKTRLCEFFLGGGGMEVKHGCDPCQ